MGGEKKKKMSKSEMLRFSGVDELPERLIRYQQVRWSTCQSRICNASQNGLSVGVILIAGFEVRGKRVEGRRKIEGDL